MRKSMKDIPQLYHLIIIFRGKIRLTKTIFLKQRKKLMIKSRCT